jgi:hypothetical protein
MRRSTVRAKPDMDVVCATKVTSGPAGNDQIVAWRYALDHGQNGWDADTFQLQGRRLRAPAQLKHPVMRVLFLGSTTEPPHFRRRLRPVIGVRAMDCMACGAEMVLMNVVQDDTIIVPGFEQRTFICCECQEEERRLVFTKRGGEGDTEHTPKQAATPVLPASITQDEHLTTSGLLNGPLQGAQTASVETTLPVEMSQPLPVELTVQNRQPLRQRTTAWAKALEKLHTQKERVTARRVAADEAERRAQFDRFWDNLLSVPSLSNSSEGLSYVNPDKPVQTPVQPINSPQPTARDEPLGVGAGPERRGRRWSGWMGRPWRRLIGERR